MIIPWLKDVDGHCGTFKYDPVTYQDLIRARVKFYTGSQFNNELLPGRQINAELSVGVEKLPY